LSVINGMTSLPTDDELNQLSPAELVALVRQLIARVRQLEAEVEALKKPPTNSRNSSQPPSRDWKVNWPESASTKNRGAQPGHSKAERPLVDHPSMVVHAPVTVCDHCGADLQHLPAARTIRRQIVELPALAAVILETQQDEVVCPDCHHAQTGVLPEGLAATRQFGPRLEALVTYLHHEHHVSFQRLQSILQDVLGIDLSAGGAVAILERAGAAAQPEAAAIGEAVRHSAVIGSDETSARVNGSNWWEWVFESLAGEYHLIVPSRGFDVIEAFMQQARANVWRSDCWKAQLKAPTDTHQLCLAHQIRNLQGLIDHHPHLRWAHELQDLFRAAIHLGNRRDRLTGRGFQAQITRLEKRLDRLLACRVTRPDAVKLLDRYRTHRDHLFVFLYRPDVAPTNNACERALRPSVIHRKVMGSFRSEWGAQAYAALATVLNTAKRHGDNVFTKLVHLMGTPILHYLTPSTA
jgi:transposase